MPYTEDRGITFRINTGFNLTGASATKVEIKPTGAALEWDCTVYDEGNGILEYITALDANELHDLLGTVQGQAKITYTTGEIYHGTFFSFTVTEVLVPTT